MRPRCRDGARWAAPQGGGEKEQNSFQLQAADVPRLFWLETSLNVLVWQGCLGNDTKYQTWRGAIGKLWDGKSGMKGLRVNMWNLWRKNALMSGSSQSLVVGYVLTQRLEVGEKTCVNQGKYKSDKKINWAAHPTYALCLSAAVHMMVQPVLYCLAWIFVCLGGLGGSPGNRWQRPV